MCANVTGVSCVVGCFGLRKEVAMACAAELNGLKREVSHLSSVLAHIKNAEN